jgi:uncharacterized protein YegL
MSTVLPELAENHEDRCPVVLVLDTSYSMLDSNNIGKLNQGVKQFRDQVLKDPIAALRIEIAVVKFGGTVKVLHEFKTAHDFDPPELTADGNTPMGEAVQRALDLIETRKVTYKGQGVNYYRPWLWLMTDGAPTDNWQSAAAACKQAERDRKVSVFTVGVGDAAGYNVLEQFGEKPPMKLKGMAFGEMFRWLSASLAKVSNQKAGTGEVTLPPTDGWGKAYA